MRSFTPLLASLLVALVANADIQAGVPYPAPPGFEQWTSPIVPAPLVNGAGDWAQAVAKARKFVSQLTLQEKVNVTTGIGINARCLGNTGAITRLGFDGFCLHDSPLGIRLADFVSVFPAGVTTASTWDQKLINARGVAMGEEFRGKGINVALGPAMNLGRVAAGGRGWESFSGDPYITGIAAAETIKGIQSKGVIACAKHFVANEQEHFRGGSLSEAYSSNLDDRTMHEIYAWPFGDSLHAGVGSVMCAYNRLNQTFACENSKIMNGILKTEMNFQGFVTSDWAAMLDGVNSALGGTDMNMPGFKAYGNPPDVLPPSESDNTFWGKYLVEAVNNGSISMERLDDMLIRPFSSYFKMGQDKGFPKLNFDVITTADSRPGSSVITNEHVNVQGDHKKIIREVAAAGTILLKNEGKALPLNLKKTRRIGVFGSDAGPHPFGPNFCSNGQGDHACNEGTLAIGWGSGTANFPYLIDPLSAIQSYVRDSDSGATVDYHLNDWSFSVIDKVATYADACLVFSSADSGEGYLTVDGNAGDRNNLTLWNNGDNLIKHTASQCSNTIVVLHTVGAVLMEEWINHPNVTAVVYAHLPGQESGNSLVDILFGKVNPSGRLTYTIAKKRDDYNADVIYKNPGNLQITYSEGLNIDYRHFDAANIEPRFEFGFGLSYTTFKYSGLKVTKSIPKRQEIALEVAANNAKPTPIPQGGDAALWRTALTVTFNVQNTGGVAGNEVSQVYLGFPASAEEPPKVLRGFQRTYIKDHASSKVTIELTKRDISIWDVVSQSWVVPSGKFEVFVGASSRDIRLTGSFTA